MFGDRIAPDEPKDDVMKRVVEGFQRMAASREACGRDRPHRVARRLHALGRSRGDPDPGRTPRSSRFSGTRTTRSWPARSEPADTYAKLGKWIRHTHLKDSKPEGTDRRYVLLGTGDVPVKEQVKVLAGAGYKGYYCLEWEKKWHPEIEEPEVAFPQYATTMREYLTEAGVKPA